MACFAPAAPIPRFILDYNILARLCPNHHPEEVSQGLAALHAVGLIDLRFSEAPGETAYVVIHPLVRETILLDGKNDPATKAVVGAAIDLLDSAVNSLNPESPDQWPLWPLLTPHAYSLLDLLLPGLENSGPVTLFHAVQVLADALIWAGSYVSSQELTEAALRRAMSLLPEHEETLRLRHVHALANLHLRSLVEAENELRAIIAIQKQKLGFNHIDTLSSSHDLAATLSRKGQFSEAETLYREILESHVKAPHPDRRAELNSRHEFARVLVEQGKFDEAESQYHELLAARIRIIGIDHPRTLITRFRVADLSAKLGRLSESEQLFTAVLNDGVRVLGSNHPDTLKIRSGLAKVLELEDRISEADRQFQLVLDGRQKVLGSYHPLTRETQAALNNLRGNGTDAS
jgi:tetratricopeptide (TPR) repeat protein